LEASKNVLRGLGANTYQLDFSSSLFIYESEAGVFRHRPPHPVRLQPEFMPETARERISSCPDGKAL
jgi:hypothetical protein